MDRKVAMKLAEEFYMILLTAGNDELYEETVAALRTISSKLVEFAELVEFADK